MDDFKVWLLVVLAAVNLLVLAWLALRRPAGDEARAELQAGLAGLTANVSAGNERLERELRREISESSRGGRQEPCARQQVLRRTPLRFPSLCSRFFLAAVSAICVLTYLCNRGAPAPAVVHTLKLGAIGTCSPRCWSVSRVGLRAPPALRLSPSRPVSHGREEGG